EEMIVEEVFGRPQAPRWLGAGAPMSAALAQRVYQFRAHAGELLRDSDAALDRWLRFAFRLGGEARAMLASYFQTQETFSEIPPPGALLIECVAMQSCVECFVHTPLTRSANQALARVFAHRMNKAANIEALNVAADLGIYLVMQTDECVTPEQWRA